MWWQTSSRTAQKWRRGEYTLLESEDGKLEYRLPKSKDDELVYGLDTNSEVYNKEEDKPVLVYWDVDCEEEEDKYL